MLLVSGHCANGCGIVDTRDELLALSKPPFTFTGMRHQKKDAEDVEPV